MAPVASSVQFPGAPAAAAAPSYIVESTLQCDHGEYDEPVFQPMKTIPRLTWGFTITVWNPGRPEVVQEIHWNTPEEREKQRHEPGEVGSITERIATEREKREGLRQHEERARG